MIIKNNLNKFAKISAVLLAGGVLAQGNSFKNFGEIFNSNCIVANAFESREKGYEILKRGLESFQEVCELYYNIFDGKVDNISDIKQKINNFVSSVNEIRKANGLLNPILVNLVDYLERNWNTIKNNLITISNGVSNAEKARLEQENYICCKRISDVIFLSTKDFRNAFSNFINSFETKYGTFNPDELRNIKFYSNRIVDKSYKFYAQAAHTIPIQRRSDNEKTIHIANITHSYAELQKIFDVNKVQPKSSDIEKDPIINTTVTKKDSNDNDKKKGIALSKTLDKKDISKDTKGVPKTSIDASSNLLGFTIGSGIIGISSLISSLKIKRRKK